MRQTTKAQKAKTSERQQYNKAYYEAHKNDKNFKARRKRNAEEYRVRPVVKRKRNAKLREKWASDPEYRAKISAYQKAWRERRKRRMARLAKAQSRVLGARKATRNRG